MRRHRERLSTEQREAARQKNSTLQSRIRSTKKSVTPKAVAQFVGGEILINDSTPQYNCGEMNIICSSCGSLNFKNEWAGKETFSYCCQNGRV